MKVTNTIMERWPNVFNAIKMKGILGIIGTFLVNIVGANYLAFEILFVLIIIDALTGFMKGIKNKNVNGFICPITNLS